MNSQKLMLDLSDLDVESVEVVPADSLGWTTYGYGMTELAASSSNCECDCSGSCSGGCRARQTMLDDSDDT